MIRVPGDRCSCREGVREVVIVSALAGVQDPREGTSEEEYARQTSQEGCSQQKEQHRQREVGVYLSAMATVCIEKRTEVGGQTEQPVKCLECLSQSPLQLEHRVRNEATGQEAESPGSIQNRSP